MEERRRLERFQLQTPASVEVRTNRGKKILDGLTTKDVSSGGAFLVTSQRFLEGSRLKMEFCITVEMLTKLMGEGTKTKIMVDGTVVRVSNEGIAIRFDNRYRMVNLQSGC